MRKSNKKRDQKRSAKARKQQADKIAATKQKEQYEGGFMRAIERDRERMRRNKRHPNVFGSLYGASALQLAAMEQVISDFDDAAMRRSKMQEMLLKRG